MVNLRSLIRPVAAGIVAATGLVGCKNVPPQDLAASGTSPSTVVPGTSSAPIATPSATTASPFSLSLFTTYSGTGFNYPLTFAETGTTSCTANVGTAVTSCSVAVPEGRLYFSDLSIAFSWLPTACKLLTFRPYGYQASTSASYVPPGAASSVDCSGATVPMPAACYGGAAKSLVANYSIPSVIGTTYLPNESSLTVPNSLTLVVPAAATALAGSDRQTSNDMPASKVGNSYTSAQMGGVGDGYVANTYSNYQFTCRDDWYDPQTYVINLNVTDVDTTTGVTPTIDNFYTWRELP